MSAPERLPDVPPRPPASALALLDIAVVIPAHNEEKALPACLASVKVACAQLKARHPHIEVRTLTVLDSCTDKSAQVAARAGVPVITVHVGNVGASRGAGCEAVLAASTVPKERMWIAMTDADTHVPPNWLTSQVDFAHRGIDVVIGTAEPDPRFSGRQRQAWFDAHDLREGHAHVHGANLGFRANVYEAVGGFQPLSSHEDVDLVTRLRSHACVVVATDKHRVVTSSRRVSRTTEGFAVYLNRLRKEVR